MDRDFDQVEYFEDYSVGDRFRASPIEFSDNDIMSFAREYDPQPFHLDLDEAARSLFGGLVASGSHTLCKCWGHLLRSGFLAGRAMGAWGLEEIRWPRPVRAGDRIRIEAEVLAVRPSATKSDRGYVEFAFQAYNQRDEMVMSYRATQIIARGPGDGP